MSLDDIQSPFQERDAKRLVGVHPDLIKVYVRACKLFPIAFASTPGFKLFVIEGVRTRKTQSEYVKIGASWTENSKHLVGMAMDLGIQANGKMRWEMAVYQRLWESVVRVAADELDVSMLWGGTWKQKDGPHFELLGEKYATWRKNYAIV